jgi:hypothetical protein
MNAPIGTFALHAPRTTRGRSSNEGTRHLGVTLALDKRFGGWKANAAASYGAISELTTSPQPPL